MASVTHELLLLLRLSKVDVCNKIEIGTGGELSVVVANENSRGSGFTTTDFAHSVAVVVPEQMRGHSLHAIKCEEGVADSKLQVVPWRSVGRKPV